MLFRNTNYLAVEWLEKLKLYNTKLRYGKQNQHQKAYLCKKQNLRRSEQSKFSSALCYSLYTHIIMAGFQ